MSEASGVSKLTKQGAEGCEPKWSWVEASVWNERMLAALDNGVEGGRGFSLIDKVQRRGTLHAAWRRVAANAGAAGVDRQTVERFAAGAEGYVHELEQALKGQTYQPGAVKRVEIPKEAGKVRPLGIPTVKDRIVQTALKGVIEPIFEREFLDMSYGFRPGRSCKDALREVDQLVRLGYTHVVDADLKGYFDSIPHAALKARVAQRISDGRVLGLIEAFLRQDILKGMQRWRPTAGTPQGAVISPLLANIYLHPLDWRLQQQGYRMVRYADDFVVLCRSAEEAQAALSAVRLWVEQNGLELNAEKTHVGDCRVPGEGFEFLGYRFEAGRRWVRRKSLHALRDRIRDKTKRSCGQSLARIIAGLNPVLKGWFNYFKHVHPAVFAGVDGFVRRRLRSVLSMHLRKGCRRGRSAVDHARWPNAYFAAAGLFTMVEACRAARRSR